MAKFTVAQDSIGYRISIGDGHPISVRTAAEACTAMRHFYASPDHWRNPVAACPFCKAEGLA